MVSSKDGFSSETEGRRSSKSRSRRGAKAATRLLVLNGGAGKLPIEEELATAGYDVVARAQNPEQAFTFTANLLPDVVLVFLDSLERASALLAMRVLGNRYPCAIVVLAQRLDRAMLVQLKMVKPHAVAPLPVATEILDATIHSALDAASQRSEARQARLRSGAESGPVPAGFDTHFNLAVGRATRNGTTFAAGAIDFVPDELDEDNEISPQLAAEATERLKSHLRQYDVLQTRSDGTLVFLAEEVGPDELEALGERVLRALTGSPRAAHERFGAWPAIGMALWSAPGHDPHGLLHAAEEAMAQAKVAGGACWRIAQQEVAAKPAQAQDQSAAPPTPSQVEARRRRPLVILQRAIGWISLGVLLWVFANYAGFNTTERLAQHTERVVSFVMSLR